MNELKTCQFNLDTNCVELTYTDRCRIAIDVLAVEDALDVNLSQRSELDWLIYNKPWEYAELVLKGELETYLSYPYEHGTTD